MDQENYKLILGTQNWSSWSLRAWLMCRQSGIPFTVDVIHLRQPESKPLLNERSPSGLVPCLYKGHFAIWDSLAIGEYLAEQAPTAGLWPQNQEARALARSVSAEMHSGFAPLRTSMPMDIFARMKGFHPDANVASNIQRITTIWTECRKRQQAQEGDFLFGNWCIADAMYAPIVSRFITYDIALEGAAKDYLQAVWEHPFMHDWRAECEKELSFIGP